MYTFFLVDRLIHEITLFVEAERVPRLMIFLQRGKTHEAWLMAGAFFFGYLLLTILWPVL